MRYIYRWKPKRWGNLVGLDRKGHVCAVLARGSMNSALVGKEGVMKRRFQILRTGEMGREILVKTEHSRQKARQRAQKLSAQPGMYGFAVRVIDDHERSHGQWLNGEPLPEVGVQQ